MLLLECIVDVHLRMVNGKATSEVTLEIPNWLNMAIASMIEKGRLIMTIKMLNHQGFPLTWARDVVMLYRAGRYEHDGDWAHGAKVYVRRSDKHVTEGGLQLG